MLFNHKQEAHLAGYTSTVTEILPEEIKGNYITDGMLQLTQLIIKVFSTIVGAKKVKSVSGLQQAPPLSGDCFWQFEKVTNPLNGIQ